MENIKSWLTQATSFRAEQGTISQALHHPSVVWGEQPELLARNDMPRIAPIFKTEERTSSTNFNQISIPSLCHMQPTAIVDICSKKHSQLDLLQNHTRAIKNHHSITHAFLSCLSLSLNQSSPVLCQKPPLRFSEPTAVFGSGFDGSAGREELLHHGLVAVDGRQMQRCNTSAPKGAPEDDPRTPTGTEGESC